MQKLLCNLLGAFSLKLCRNISNITEHIDKQHDHCELLLRPTGTHGDPTNLIHQNLKCMRHMRQIICDTVR